MTDEEIVRIFLHYTDTGDLPDSEEVEKIDRRLEEAKDPLERLRLHGERQQALITPERMVMLFIDAAPRWAAAQTPPLDRSAFITYGVAASIVDAAFPTRQRPQRTARRRRGSITKEQVIDWVKHQKGTFIISDVVAGTKSSPATVQGAIAEMVRDGQLVKEGERANTRGRPSALYRVA